MPPEGQRVTRGTIRCVPGHFSGPDGVPVRFSGLPASYGSTHFTNTSGLIHRKRVFFFGKVVSRAMSSGTRREGPWDVTSRHSVHRAFYAHWATHVVINLYYAGPSSTNKRRPLFGIPTPLLTIVAPSSLIPEWCMFPFAVVASSSTKEVTIRLLLLR
uniref:Uncharacterized protein n=1 Tax=Ananas comosus var. bracteatus TaxID=296719 RepID=A0A6V7Q220_ANACO|nr:unnamed protein product [Ananas comosus var. bracteatus]